MKCSICAAGNRKKIDAALVKEGATIRGTARQFGVSHDALTRHVQNGHVLQRIAKAQKAQDIVEADSLLQEIQEIQGHQKIIFKEERDLGNNRLALEALRDQSKIVELKGKVLGSFIKDKPSPEISMYQMPDAEVEKRAREILTKRK